MQAALHFFAHSVQFTHLLVFITGLRSGNLEKKLKMVPTGQMVLHHVLPFLKARTAMIISVTAAMAKVPIDLI